MSKNNPLVSAIIPVYNGEGYLAEAIESILKQTYQPIEIIVVDDGSTDNSADIARSYKEVGYIYQANQGVATARNTGISEARGEFIAFLDQDDLWTPNKLSLQIDYLLKHQKIGYVIAKESIFLEPGTNLPSWLRNSLLQSEHTGYLPGTLVARKTVFEQIGNFESKYVTSSDAEWFFRAKDVGIPMGYLPEVLLYKRTHGANQSYDTKTTTSEVLRIVKSSIDRKRDQKAKKKI